MYAIAAHPLKMGHKKIANEKRLEITMKRNFQLPSRMC